MRITFVSPAPSLAGGIRVIATYADRLAARGHDVVVLVPKPRPPSRRERARALLRGRWLRSGPGRSHYDAMRAELRVLSYDGLLDPDLVPDADAVIATWWETAFTVAHLPASKGRKFYFVQHHEDWDVLPRHISMGSYFLPLKKITIAGWLVDLMRGRYGDDSVALVPNSVDRSLFFAPERGRQAVPTVGLMYSTLTFKGTDVSFRAIEIARRSVPDLCVVAFGAEPVSKDLPLPRGVRFVQSPPQDALRGLYAQCDLWLVGSRSEGFGLPILEAMTCRCPVVATRTGCAPDVIEDGVNGYLADVDDAEGLAAGLVKVLRADPAGWRAMSDAAHACAVDYDWDAATTLFEEALTA